MEIKTKETSVYRNCDICGVKNIHINDFENHIKTEKHICISKILDDSLNKTGDSNRVDCDVCDVKSIHKNDFIRHIRSRKHLINYKNSKKSKNQGTKSLPSKKVRKDVTIESSGKIDIKNTHDSTKYFTAHGDGKASQAKFHAFSHLNTVEIEEEIKFMKIGSRVVSVEEEEFCRKKYKTRSDVKIEEYTSYTFNIICYLTMKMVFDSKIKDFKISVNDRRYLSFGDVVIQVIYSEKSVNYAIKCKSISMNTKQIDSLSDAKIFLNKEYKCIEPLKNQKDYGITKFLLYTTANTGSNFKKQISHSINNDGESKIFNIIQNRKYDVINVSPENDSIFSIHPEDSTLNLPPLFLYTNQKIFLHTIDNFLKKEFSNYPSIFQNYYNYIENWASGKLGGNYILTKNDIILKLGELLLGPYIIIPKIVNFKSHNFDIWNDIITKIDVIIVKAEPFILSKLCEPFNQLIENSLSVKFDSITNTVTINEEDLSQLEDPKIKAYLFEEEHELENIHLTKIYRVFWKAGQIPLLLSLENNEDSKGFILDVISFMKSHGLKKKFLLKSEVPFQFFRKPPENLKIFSCLDDVKQHINLNDIKIQITSKDSLSLDKISESDPFFLKWVTPSIFMDLVLDRITLNKDESSKFDLNSDLKIILDDITKQHIHELLYGCPCEEGNLGRLTGIDPTLF